MLFTCPTCGSIMPVGKGDKEGVCRACKKQTEKMVVRRCSVCNRLERAWFPMVTIDGAHYCEGTTCEDEGIAMAAKKRNQPVRTMQSTLLEEGWRTTQSKQWWGHPDLPKLGVISLREAWDYRCKQEGAKGV